MSEKKAPSWAKRHPKLLVILVIVTLDILLALFFFSAQKHYLTVAFLNVGQGDAVFVEAPNGTQLLYDTGPPSGAVLRELSRLMPFWDRSIDVLVLSHPDLDHIGGALDVLGRYKVDVVLESGASSTNSAYQEEETLMATTRIPQISARQGMSVDLGGGVFADILYPDQNPTNEDTNDVSISMRIRYGSTSFMLSGDLPQRGEYQVLRLNGWSALHSNVLKLGHHGSRTSSSETWLTTLDPDVAIISAGRDNRYGHPHKEVTDLLTRLGIRSFATYADGTITFESNGETVKRK